MRCLIALLIFTSGLRALADVGFAAPVFKKSNFSPEKNGQIIVDPLKKKFFAVEDLSFSFQSSTVTWTAFNSTVPMLTCWQGFKPEIDGAEGRWRRVGDTMEIIVRIDLTSSFKEQDLQVSLPMGVVPKDSLYELDVLGEGTFSGSLLVQVFYDAKKKSLVPRVVGKNGQLREMNQLNFTDSDYINFKAQTPISGWSDSAPSMDEDC